MQSPDLGIVPQRLQELAGGNAQRQRRRIFRQRLRERLAYRRQIALPYIDIQRCEYRNVLAAIPAVLQFAQQARRIIAASGPRVSEPQQTYEDGVARKRGCALQRLDRLLVASQTAE